MARSKAVPQTPHFLNIREQELRLVDRVPVATFLISDVDLSLQVKMVVISDA